MRLDHCERFLGVRPAERAGQKFMVQYGVGEQRLVPLSLSGNAFEHRLHAYYGLMLE